MQVTTTTAYVCQECEGITSSEHDLSNLYQCGNCESVFTHESNGSNKCPDCGKFAYKSGDAGCPDCEAAECTEKEVFACGVCAEPYLNSKEAEECCSPEQMAKWRREEEDRVLHIAADAVRYFQESKPGRAGEVAVPKDGGRFLTALRSWGYQGSNLHSNKGVLNLIFEYQRLTRDEGDGKDHLYKVRQHHFQDSTYVLARTFEEAFKKVSLTADIAYITRIHDEVLRDIPDLLQK